MFRRQAVTWSPVEVTYLTTNRSTADIGQLCIALAKTKNAIKRKLDELDGKKLPTKASRKRTNIGKRKDLDLFLRSSWEANTCRVLNKQRRKWEYEPETFIFEGVKHGTVNYTPDFRIGSKKKYKWLEVKGFLKNSDKTRVRRFKKHFPKEFAKLEVIVGSKNTAAAIFFEEMGVPVFAYYNDLRKKYSGKIKEWE